MMQLKKSLLAIFLVLQTSILTIPFANANPVPYPYNPFEISIFYTLPCILGFIITIVIEFLIGSLLIGKKRLEFKSLFKIIFLINAITYPFTQLVGIIFIIFFLPVFILEVFVIISEWLLISNSFTKYRESHLEYKLDPKIQLFLYSLTANLLSFLTGFLIFNTAFLYNIALLF